MFGKCGRVMQIKWCSIKGITQRSSKKGRKKDAIVYKVINLKNEKKIIREKWLNESKSFEIMNIILYTIYIKRGPRLTRMSRSYDSS